MKYNILLILSFILLSVDGFSQFSVNLELRPRFELRNGYKQLPDSASSPAIHISQRSRLNLNYRNDKIATCFSIQDIRLWGNAKSVNQNPGIILHQAWGSYSLTNKFDLKIGRQELKYDNSRLIGISNWNQYGQTHDALLLKYKTDSWQIDLGGGFNQSTDTTFGTNYNPLNEAFYKTLNLFWISKSYKKLRVSTLNIADGNQKAGTTNTIYLRLTSGIIFNYTSDLLLFTARAFKQIGKNINGQQLDTYLINSDLDFNWTERLKSNFGLELKSGNNYKSLSPNTDKAFDILYGSPHVFNGNMDYFNKPFTTKGAGLNNFYSGIIYKITPKIRIKTDYHYFMLNNHCIINNTFVDKYLASEIDFDFLYTVHKDLFIIFGFSVLKGTKALELIKGRGNSEKLAYWSFVMLSFKPELFNSK